MRIHIASGVIRALDMLLPLAKPPLIAAATRSQPPTSSTPGRPTMKETPRHSGQLSSTTPPPTSLPYHRTGPTLPTARVTDALPLEVNYLGNLQASSGTCGEASGIITWTGEVPASAPVTITFGVTVSQWITKPRPIVNTALIDDGLGHVDQRQAIANGLTTYLPLILK